MAAGLGLLPSIADFGGLERSLDKAAASRAIATLSFKQADGQQGGGGPGDRSRLFG